MLTGSQIRAARALLKWSATDLAQRSGLSYATIQRADSVDGTPTMLASNLAKIQETFEAAGIAFTGMTGVSLPERTSAGSP